MVRRRVWVLPAILRLWSFLVPALQATGRDDSSGSALVYRPVRSGGGRSSSTSLVSRSSQTASCTLSSFRDPQSVSSCLVTVQRFARAEGFSSRLASQIGFAWRAASHTNFKWSVYGQWCHSEGHSFSCPTLPKIGDFLFWLRKTRKLSVSSILGYRSMLLSVFRFKLPEISLSSVLKDFICSFTVETPVRRSVHLPGIKMRCFAILSLPPSNHWLQLLSVP